MWDVYINQNKKCKYTNFLISFPKSSRDKDTASLDRIDPTKGYTKNNIQWVHKDINYMKWKFSDLQFVNYCKIISNNLTKV
jgi:hypothetical protein